MAEEDADAADAARLGIGQRGVEQNLRQGVEVLDEERAADCRDAAPRPRQTLPQQRLARGQPLSSRHQRSRPRRSKYLNSLRNQGRPLPALPRPV